MNNTKTRKTKTTETGGSDATDNGLGGFKEAQGFVPFDGTKYREKEKNQNAQYGRCDFEIDLETGAVSLKRNTMDGQGIIDGITRGFENGIGFSYLENTLRKFLDDPNCGNFEVKKFKHPKDPKYPQLNALIVSIERCPPSPLDELAPY